MATNSKRPNIKRIKAQSGSAAKVVQQYENYNEVMQKSQGKLGEDRSALRQKSLAQTSTASNFSNNGGQLLTRGGNTTTVATSTTVGGGIKSASFNYGASGGSFSTGVGGGGLQSVKN